VSALLRIEAVSKRFSKKLDAIEKLARALGAAVSEHTVHAVDRVSFDVDAREVVGLVGESGAASRLSAGWPAAYTRPARDRAATAASR